MEYFETGCFDHQSIKQTDASSMSYLGDSPSRTHNTAVNSKQMAVGACVRVRGNINEWWWGGEQNAVIEDS